VGWLPQRLETLVDVHGVLEPNGETFRMDIWSNYMAEATQCDLSLEFPEAEESDLDVLRGDYSSGFKQACFAGLSAI
jgi:hypothetical protein